MSRYSANYRGSQALTSEPNIYWYERSQVYRMEITREKKKIKRCFYVVDYKSKELAFAAAVKCKNDFVEQYPERRNCNPGAGNDAWKALSNYPRKRPTSQLLEWHRQSK